jgi:mono/diheme cytochrome c family protein
MRRNLRQIVRKPWVWALGALCVAGVAVASPWDIDMIDGVSSKAFEWKMMTPKVEGTVQRPSGVVTRPGVNGTYQNDYVAAIDRNAPETELLTSPFGDTPEQVATGTRLFRVNCAPCHGLEGKGGGPVTENHPDKGQKRFMIPAPHLSGDGSRLNTVSDGFVYSMIRYGGLAAMPAYAVGLTEKERWAVITYMRTLPNAGRPAPKAPEPPPTPATPPAGSPK